MGLRLTTAFCFLILAAFTLDFKIGSALLWRLLLTAGILFFAGIYSTKAASSPWRLELQQWIYFPLLLFWVIYSLYQVRFSPEHWGTPISALLGMNLLFFLYRWVFAEVQISPANAKNNMGTVALVSAGIMVFSF